MLVVLLVRPQKKSLPAPVCIPKIYLGRPRSTVSWANRCFQIEKTSWRGSLAGCRITVYEHLDGTVSIGHCPPIVGRYTAEGVPLKKAENKSDRRERAA